jgi:hypothetical protein
MTRYDVLGSSCTGTDGTANRTLALTAIGENLEVYVDGVLYTYTTQYTAADTTVTTITFVVPVWNTQLISVIYTVTTTSVPADSTYVPVNYYTTVQEARNFLGVSINEISTQGLLQHIKRASQQIDKIATRTWGVPVTYTDELYDGDGTDLLFLRNVDIQSVSALSIRETPSDSTATYSTVSTSTIQVYSDGYIMLYTDAAVNLFTAGAATVKITYVTGASQSNALSSGISDSATTIAVTSTTGFKSRGTIIIDGEWIEYTGLTSTTFTGCTRGALGTSAASHNSAASVYQAPPENVRHLCILLMAQNINKDNTRNDEIRRLFGEIEYEGPLVV